MGIDLNITKTDENGEERRYFDINVVGGDIETVENFDSSLKVSLFADERASKTEIIHPELRRGWWGDEVAATLGQKIGSKLWLLHQNRRTQDVLNSAIDYAKTALEWLIEDGHADNVEVQGAFLENGIRLTIRIIRDGSPVESKYFDLWENTGKIN